MLVMIKLAAIAALFLWVYVFFLLLSEQGRTGISYGRVKGGRCTGMTPAQKAEIVTELVEKNPALAKCLLRQSGLGHLPLKKTSPALVEELARRANVDHLEVLKVASSQRDVDFDLKATRLRQEVSYPTNDIEPVSMRNFEQLAGVLPAHLLADDDEFYRRLATSELMILQSYATSEQKKTLHILMDVSGSMEERMTETGVMRHTWSRAVAISLLLKAVQSEANYLGRPFDDLPHELWQVESEKQAEEVMDFVINYGASGGGTHICRAIAQACSDVAPQVAEFGSADVLVITDGRDDNLSEADLKKLLGDKISLHVASIGGRASAALVSCSTTYREFK